MYFPSSVLWRMSEANGSFTEIYTTYLGVYPLMHSKFSIFFMMAITTSPHPVALQVRPIHHAGAAVARCTGDQQ